MIINIKSSLKYLNLSLTISFHIHGSFFKSYVFPLTEFALRPTFIADLRKLTSI